MKNPRACRRQQLWCLSTAVNSYLVLSCPPSPLVHDLLVRASSFILKGLIVLCIWLIRHLLGQERSLSFFSVVATGDAKRTQEECAGSELWPTSAASLLLLSVSRSHPTQQPPSLKFVVSSSDDQCADPSRSLPDSFLVDPSSSRNCFGCCSLLTCSSVDARPWSRSDPSTFI